MHNDIALRKFDFPRFFSRPSFHHKYRLIVCTPEVYFGLSARNTNIIYIQTLQILQAYISRNLQDILLDVLGYISPSLPRSKLLK